MTPFGDVLASADDLAAIYGPPVDAVTNKIIDRLDGHCRDFIARAPFVLVATADAAGNCDVSPKGGRSWLRAGPRRAAARDSRRAGEQAGLLAPQHRRYRTRRAPLRDPGSRRDAARQRARVRDR